MKKGLRPQGCIAGNFNATVTDNIDPDRFLGDLISQRDNHVINKLPGAD